MTLSAVLLLVLSAGLHAGWNLFSKRQHPSAAFFLVATFVGGLCLLPMPVLLRVDVRLFPPRVWAFAAFSGFCLAFYYASLAGAYRMGHMSVAYPLARSLPALLVILVAVLLGRQEQITARCMAGVALIVAGCLILPMAHFRDFRPTHYFNPSCLLALCAAFGTAGYSMSDDQALRCLREAPRLDLPPLGAALTYAGFEAMGAFLWLLLFVGTRKASRVELGRLLVAGKGKAAVTGMAIYCAYVLVLVAMAFVKDVSYVVAFRQLSVPLGAGLGVVLLGEPPHPPKFVGVAIAFAGLVLVGTG